MLQDLDILEDWTAIRKVLWNRTKRWPAHCVLSFDFLLFLRVSAPQAMASLAPHRVKVDGKSLSLSSVTVNVWLSATIDPQASRSRRFNSFFSRTKKFIVEQETAVTLFGLAFPLRSVFLLNVPPSLSLQSSLNDSSMWRASRTAGFSTTTSGTAGDRPSASTGRRSTRPGGSTGGGGGLQHLSAERCV